MVVTANRVGDGKVERGAARVPERLGLPQHAGLGGEAMRQPHARPERLPVRDPLGVGLVVVGERPRRRVAEAFGPDDRGHRPHEAPMDDGVQVPALRFGTGPGPAGDVLAADDDAGVREAAIDAREVQAAGREAGRRVRFAADPADADDQRLVVRLGAHGAADAAASPGLADVSRRADAALDLEARRAGHDVDAALEEVVADRPVVVVAQQRRPQEALVGVVAARIDAERAAVLAAAHANEQTARPEHPLDVRFAQLDLPAVWVGSSERIGGVGRSARPRRFDVDAVVAREIAEQAQLGSARRGVALGGVPAGEVELRGNRLRGAARRHHQERERTGRRGPEERQGHATSSTAPARTVTLPLTTGPAARQARHV